MSDPPTPFSPPSTLPYPITLTRLLVKPGSSVSRGDKLLEYSFLSSTRRRELEKRARASEAEGEEGVDESKWENDMMGSWESPVGGEVVKWVGVEVGKKVERRFARCVATCTSRSSSVYIWMKGRELTVNPAALSSIYKNRVPTLCKFTVYVVSVVLISRRMSVLLSSSLGNDQSL
jgi:RNA polymerase II subunit A-like phosphatase